MWRKVGSTVMWIGILLILAGIIIVLCVVPGWFWCALAALLLIVVGIFLLKPMIRR